MARIPHDSIPTAEELREFRRDNALVDYEMRQRFILAQRLMAEVIGHPHSPSWMYHVVTDAAVRQALQERLEESGYKVLTDGYGLTIEW